VYYEFTYHTFFFPVDNFLLRFLRVKKFSLPMAQQVLLKYINFRQTFPHLTYNLDYLTPSVNELISKGSVQYNINPKNGPLNITDKVIVRSFIHFFTVAVNQTHCLNELTKRDVKEYCHCQRKLLK